MCISFLFDVHIYLFADIIFIDLFVCLLSIIHYLSSIIYSLLSIVYLILSIHPSLFLFQTFIFLPNCIASSFHRDRIFSAITSHQKEAHKNRQKTPMNVQHRRIRREAVNGKICDGKIQSVVRQNNQNLGVVVRCI